MPAHPHLVLGVDGGASSTLALLADAATGVVVGRGEGGPSNLQAIGEVAALAELDSAVGRAFVAAGIDRRPVAAACLGLAGVDLDARDVIDRWAAGVGLADRLSIANDATLLFAAGTPDGWGLAVICGTGSIAFSRDPHGREARAGGWGYLMGDEGSAWMVGLLGLRAACRAADGVIDTALLPVLLAELGSADPRDFIPAVYRGSWDKARIAGLAPAVVAAAEAGDPVAHKLVVGEVTELARTAVAAADRNRLSRLGVPVALAGGLVLQNEFYRRLFLEALTGFGLHPGTVGLVDEPAVGAVVMARKLADGQSGRAGEAGSVSTLSP